MEITIWVTYDCNMECTYCYERKKGHAIMSESTCNEVLRFIYNLFTSDKDSLFHSIVFHGGEPLLNYAAVEKIVYEIKDWDMGVPIFFSMTTNGTILNEEKTDFLVNNIDEISISLDGTHKTHSRCRSLKDGFDNYEDIEANVKNILKSKMSKCNFRARMTITPESGKELYENIKYLCDMGFTKIVPVLDCFSKWTNAEIEQLYIQMTKVYKEISKHSPELSIGLIDDISLREPGFCLAGIEHMHISPEGQIFPCAYVMGVTEYLLGNVVEGIDSKKIKWLMEINGSPMNSDCEACAWKKFCDGNRCRLLNYVVTGDYFTPSQVTCLNERLHLRFLQEYLSKRV